ncbi:EAL domain-containing protein, partial [Vibrio makurazakiensis]|uniref:EAL domain-containing protein n=1 Tax=Vibrio makurazakiensis TaxID=2910250 RepID=UPI003D0D0EE5
SYLKIDRTLIDDDIELAAAVILAKSLGAKTIIEGVESKQQFDRCNTLGIDYFQGYFLSRPLSIPQLNDYR